MYQYTCIHIFTYIHIYTYLDTFTNVSHTCLHISTRFYIYSYLCNIPTRKWGVLRSQQVLSPVMSPRRVSRVMNGIMHMPITIESYWLVVGDGFSLAIALILWASRCRASFGSWNENRAIILARSVWYSFHIRGEFVPGFIICVRVIHRFSSTYAVHVFEQNSYLGSVLFDIEDKMGRIAPRLL